MIHLGTILNVSLIVLVCYLVYYVLATQNIIGLGKVVKVAKKEVKKDKSNIKKRLFLLKILSILELIYDNIGFSVSESRRLDLEYKIYRLRWYLEDIKRLISYKELYGLLKILQMIGLFGIVNGLITQSIIYLMLGVLVLSPYIFDMYALFKINKEDEELERDFPDLFLLLYSRLIKGTKVRLTPALKDYIRSLDSMSQQEDKKVIRNFVLDLQNNIELYGDDAIALSKIRDKYRSVLIINFCNLATQALNGVDNKDKLLSFKIELTNRRIETLKDKMEKTVQRGEIAVNIVYVILFQFVFLSWLAKFQNVKGLGKIFGL